MTVIEKVLRATGTWPTLDARQLLMAANGSLQVQFMDRVIPTKLSTDQFELFEVAKQRGWIYDKKGDALTHIFWWWCEVVEVPAVVIKKKVKYATVEMDYITTHNRLPESGQEAVRHLFMKHLNLKKGQHVYFSSGSVFMNCPRIPLGEAEEVANALVAIYRTYQKEG